jgi:hypothetical protein
MFCDRCGAGLTEAARFCPTCGKQFAPIIPPRPVQYRVASHLRTLAMLWIVYGVIHMLPGIFVGSMSRWFGFGFGFGRPWFWPGLFRVIGGFLIAKGVLAIIAGWGLHERHSWARMLAIVLGFLSLLHFPFGMALGIYTL